MPSAIRLERKPCLRHSLQSQLNKPVSATSLWGMLYADDVRVVSQSLEQLRKMMVVIVTVCGAFGLTVSEAKTEIMCLCTKGMPDATATFSVEAAGQVFKYTHEFVYLGRKVNHHADLSIEVNRRKRNAWCSFQKYSLELYDRPSAPLELKIRMLKAEVLETIIRLRHVEPARVPLRYAAPSPPQLSDPLHRMAKAQSHRPPDLLPRHPREDGE